MGRFDEPTRTLLPKEQALDSKIVAAANEIEALFNQIKTGRHRSLAYTALEEAIQRARRELRLSGLD